MGKLTLNKSFVVALMIGLFSANAFAGEIRWTCRTLANGRSEKLLVKIVTDSAGDVLELQYRVADLERINHFPKSELKEIENGNVQFTADHYAHNAIYTVSPSIFSAEATSATMLRKLRGIDEYAFTCNRNFD